MRSTYLKRWTLSTALRSDGLRALRILQVLVAIVVFGGINTPLEAQLSLPPEPADALPDSSASARAYLKLDDEPVVSSLQPGAFPIHPGGQSPSEYQWVLLPEGYIYPTYLGNPHEPRLGTQGIAVKGDHLLWDNSLGGRFGLVRFGPRNSPEGVQLDFLGGVKLRIDPVQNSDVRSYDFRADIPLTWGWGKHRWKFGYSHTSSHTGDEYLLRLANPTRVNYIRDSAVLGYSYYPVPDLRFYGQADYAIYHAVAGPWLFQFGIDFAPAGPTSRFGAPFVTLAGELHEELHFGGGFAAQAGWAWRGWENPSGILRIGLFYYNGKSTQFSFLNKFEEQIGAGMWYDF